jgi:lysine 6-dehydrogenase
MKFLILGYGMIGKAIAEYLKDYDIGIVDSDKNTLKEAERSGFEVFKEDITKKSIADLMKRYDCTISAVPYTFNYELAKKAVTVGKSFCDLGGNDTIVDNELALHEEAKRKEMAILPDCGLAPGLANILAAFAYTEDCREIHMRVGGLPQSPQGSLNYKIVFSPHGLINEYVERVRVLQNGKIHWVEPLTGLEEIQFGDEMYEAFYTSGGTSTLPQTFEGKLDRLDYKTVRYPGHCRFIRVLVELGLTDTEELCVQGKKVAPRELLVRLLSQRLSYPSKDRVLLRITAEGEKRTVYEIRDHEKEFTAMARTTAYPAALSALLVTKENVTGAVPQEIRIPQLLHERQYLRELKKREIAVEKRIEKI